MALGGLLTCQSGSPHTQVASHDEHATCRPGSAALESGAGDPAAAAAVLASKASSLQAELARAEEDLHAANARRAELAQVTGRKTG